VSVNQPLKVYILLLVKCSDILEGCTASIFRVTELYLSYRHVSQNDLKGLPSCHLWVTSEDRTPHIIDNCNVLDMLFTEGGWPFSLQIYLTLHAVG